MSISRRGLLAAGLAVAVVGTIGVVSTMNAGAAETPAVPAVAADSPPPLLPWGAKPHPIKKGPRGASSKALAKSGASAADSSVPQGSVTTVGPKGENARRHGRTSVPPMPPAKAAKADDDVQFQYVKGRQEANADNVSGLFTVANPKVGPDTWHSLAEIALESTDEDQIVEIGWNVDPGTNGDSQTHLFVYHWVNGIETCYNGCGFVPYAGATIAPGATLATGPLLKQFGIQHFNNAWWVAYDSEWIGKFPDSVWNGNFTETGVVQVFGEVASATTAACGTQMGNGLPASTINGSARIGNLAFTDGPTVNLEETSTSSVYSVAPYSPRTFYYGGTAAACPTTK